MSISSLNGNINSRDLGGRDACLNFSKDLNDRAVTQHPQPRTFTLTPESMVMFEQLNLEDWPLLLAEIKKRTIRIQAVNKNSPFFADFHRIAQNALAELEKRNEELERDKLRRWKEFEEAIKYLEWCQEGDDNRNNIQNNMENENADSELEEVENPVEYEKLDAVDSVIEKYQATAPMNDFRYNKKNKTIETKRLPIMANIIAVLNNPEESERALSRKDDEEEEKRRDPLVIHLKRNRESRHKELVGWMRTAMIKNMAEGDKQYKISEVMGVDMTRQDIIHNESLEDDEKNMMSQKEGSPLKNWLSKGFDIFRGKKEKEKKVVKSAKWNMLNMDKDVNGEIVSRNLPLNGPTEKQIQKKMHDITNILAENYPYRLIIEHVPQMTEKQKKGIATLAKQYSKFEVIDRGGALQSILKKEKKEEMKNKGKTIIHLNAKKPSPSEHKMEPLEVTSDEDGGMTLYGGCPDNNALNSDFDVNVLVPAGGVPSSSEVGDDATSSTSDDD